MLSNNSGFDPVWDQIYAGGHEQKAPWDMVVSFVYRNKPKNKKNADVNILEVGSGTASNLRFFAAEGMNVSGIEASAKAVQVAKTYFKTHNLTGDLRVGSFDVLPFDDASFDLVIDRAALVHTGTSVQQKTISEIYRVLKTRGRFLYTPYANTHTSCLSGQKYDDDLTNDIVAGTLQGVGHLRFMSRKDVWSMFPNNQWDILALDYEECQDKLTEVSGDIHAGWRVVVQKK